ncbi:MAG: DUF6265 family protein [Planctomycetota bacterium]
MRSFTVLTLALLAFSCQSQRTRSSEPSLSTELEAPVVGTGETPHIFSELSDSATARVSESVLRVDDLAWLAGRWVGEGFGGVAEETWNPPMGAEGERSMVGMFRLYDDLNAVNFYELMTLVRDDEGVALKLVHLSKELRPWEEPGETTNFRLLRVDGTTAWYEGLTMHREGDQLVVYVAMSSQTGDVREAVLRMRRMS